MNEMSSFQPSIVAQSLQGGSPTQHPIFNHPIECKRTLLEFYVYAHYRSEDDASLSYMEDVLPYVHTIKDVCLLGRAGEKAKAKANALSTELVKILMVIKKTNAATVRPCTQGREIQNWGDYISHEIAVSKELDADITFPKIYLITYWVEQIH
jgi:hypothetical protein